MSGFTDEVRVGLGFLFEFEGFEVVNEYGDCHDGMGNCQIVISNSLLDVSITRDRNQIHTELKETRMKRGEWTSMGIFRHLLTNDLGFNEMHDELDSSFLKRYFPEIKKMYLPENLATTCAQIKSAEKKRSKLLFG